MIKTILNTIFTKLLSTLLGFIILILTTQYLGAEGRGLVSLLGVAIGIILIFSGFMGGSSLVYLSSRFKISYLIFPCYFWALLVALSGTFFLAFFHIIPDSLLIPTFFISMISAVSNVNLMILIGKEKVLVNNYISIIQAITNLGTLFFFFIILNEPTVSYYIYSLYITNLIALAVGFLAIRKYLGGVPNDFLKGWETLKAMVHYGSLAQIGNVIQYLNYRVSFFILNAYSGLAALGIYSVGVTIAETVWLVSGSIALVEYSKISNVHDENYARWLTIRLSKVSFLLTSFIIGLLLCTPPAWFTVIFGKDFSTVYWVIFVMSLGICSFGYTVIISHFFAGTGRYQINAIAAFIGLIGTAVFSFLLIPPFGYIGAGVTASISYLMTSIVLIGIFIRDTHTSPRELVPTISDVREIFYEIKKLLKLRV